MAKVWKIPSIVHSSLPLPKHTHEPREFYSLYVKVNGRWNRARVECYPAGFATRVWGDRVIHNPFSYSIRKAQVIDTEAK